MVKFALALVFALLATPAFACVVLDTATPKVGSVVQTSPSNVTIKFSGRIYPEKSTLEVYDATGKKVSEGKAIADANDDSTMSVKLTNLPAGQYKVKWNVFCDCGSLTPGDYKFTVKSE